MVPFMLSCVEMYFHVIRVTFSNLWLHLISKDLCSLKTYRPSAPLKIITQLICDFHTAALQGLPLLGCKFYKFTAFINLINIH